MWGPYSPSGYPYEEEEVWAPQIAGWCKASVVCSHYVSEMACSELYVCVPIDLAVLFLGPGGTCGYRHF